jgi:outer membrane protein assembly factor BamB
MRYLAAALSLVAVLSSVATAGDWQNWRGPQFNGSSDETKLPEKFSKTENVAWSVDLPGVGSATPIVSGDHVFMSSTDKAKESVVALCFDRKTGKKLWQHEVAKGIRKDIRSTFAAPSATTDGESVVFFFGTGDMVAYDFEGKELWKKNMGPFAFGWTFSTSPVIFEGIMYMQILQRGKGKSVIVGMEPKSGKELFRHVRPTHAVGESQESFNTPTPYVHNGRKQLLVAGGDYLSGHDLKTGKELWQWDTWNPTKNGGWRLVPSPIAGDGIVLACAPKRDPIYAIKMGGSGKLDKKSIAWVSRKGRDLSSDVPTPAFYDGDFFVLSDVKKSLSRVEPKTGKVKWTVNTPGRKKYEASPLAADGKIYVMNFDGEVAILNAADGKLRSVIPMEGKEIEGFVRSSISVAHGQLYIRTTNKLYCIGK